MKVIEQLLSYPKFGKPGVLERMDALTHGLVMVPTIKVVGSNGKGTTAHMMAHMAGVLGKSVGLYTSPHLLRLNERIQINGREIDDVELTQALAWAIDRAQALEGVGRFEIFTAAALYHFSRTAIDVAIMEIGLGGRFDPVRMAPGRISVLTSIDLEHTAILGHTIKEIATEKAAVCKPGDLLISAVLGVEDCVPDGVTYMEVSDPPLSPLQSNARLAAFALKEHFSLTELPEAYGAKVPGRLQRLSSTPPLYVDVAHSVAAVQTVLDQFGETPITLVIAARRDKDFSALDYIFHHVVALQCDEDMQDPADLLQMFNAQHKDKADGVAQALDLAIRHCGHEGVIVCLGGFGIAGRVLAHFNGAHYDVIGL